MTSPKDDQIQLDYTRRDHEIVDYQFFELKDIPGLKLRGPEIDPDSSDRFFSCIGAAQTLGIYIQEPYPIRLAEKIGMPGLNLAIGAAGPGFYSEREDLIRQVNKGRFLILQVMAARGEGTQRFQRIGTIEEFLDTEKGDKVTAVGAWMRVKEESGAEGLAAYLKEVRENWVDNYRLLLSKIKVPVILFYYSPRPRDEEVSIDGPLAKNPMGRFPQMVNGECVDAIKDLCDGYVECFSDRNLGHALISRFTGELVEADYSLLGRDFPLKETHNTYYPSAEMHEDAANELVGAIEKLEQQHKGLRS